MENKFTFLYKITRVHPFQQQYYAQQVAHFSISCGQRVDPFRFLTPDCPYHECVFHVLWSANIQNIRAWGTENQREIHHGLHRQEVTVWSSAQANPVVGQYYFNHETENST